MEYYEDFGKYNRFSTNVTFYTLSCATQLSNIITFTFRVILTIYIYSSICLVVRENKNTNWNFLTSYTNKAHTDHKHNKFVL